MVAFPLDGQYTSIGEIGPKKDFPILPLYSKSELEMQIVMSELSIKSLIDKLYDNERFVFRAQVPSSLVADNFQGFTDVFGSHNEEVLILFSAD
mmetsp:Transcript_35941/g.26697  ORF Transcript_35941/g.26697 Transcript_35941/m.26697 type:complete len:94 (-) Transcript_35941:488-769(-)